MANREGVNRSRGMGEIRVEVSQEEQVILDRIASLPEHECPGCGNSGSCQQCELGRLTYDLIMLRKRKERAFN